MAELAVQMRHARRRRLTPSLRPAEGWTIVALHGLVLLAAAWAVSRGGWSDVPPSLPFVAIAGAFVGLILAKTGCPDLLAHLTAFLTGVVAVVAWTAQIFAELGPTWQSRLTEIWSRGREWYNLASSGRQHDDRYLFIIVLGVTFWLVAYMAAWTLYRRRWLTAALLLPGFVIVVNLGYAPHVGPEPLALYLVAAGTLTACHFAHRRQQEWRRFGIPAPDGLPWRFLGVGANLVILLVALAWFIPITSETAWFDRLQRGLERPLEAAQERLGEWVPNLPDTGSRPPAAYSDLADDGFELGGAEGLDATQVARLQTVGPGDRDSAYLVGGRYDRYTGQGWRISDTFEEEGPDGQDYLPQVTFEANQEVVLSSDLAGGRVEVEGRITILTEPRDQLFTIETYLTSDLPVNARLSWLQLDNEPFLLVDGSLAGIPPDLHGIADLLRRAEWETGAPGGASGSPLPTEPALARALLAEQERLSRRFLNVWWVVGAGGRVTLLVTGQLPIYDDIDVVYARSPVDPGQMYAVVGLTSTASPDELRLAGDDYPLYVEGRYLQLPPGVTPETRELAGSLAAGADNPFDVARAIEAYLRVNIEYDRGVGRVPDDRDAVDYLLFESGRGDCDFYASAMIVLLRSLDIPARMVTGFAPVPYDPAAAGYVYRRMDAHAWVEVYFPGYGWVAFEPTPSQPPRDYGPAGADSTPAAIPTAAASPTAAPTSTPVVEIGTPAGLGSLEADRGGGGSPTNWRLIVAIVLASAGLVGLTAFGLGIAWRRGLADLPPAAGWFERLLRAGRLIGVQSDPGATPREYASAVGRAVPAARRPAAVLADLYAAERYGSGVELASLRGTGDSAWRSVRRAAFRRFLRLGRPRRRRGAREVDV